MSLRSRLVRFYRPKKNSVPFNFLFFKFNQSKNTSTKNLKIEPSFNEFSCWIFTITLSFAI